MDVFIETLSETGNVRKAARKAAISRGHAYRMRSHDPDFAKAWDEAVDCAVRTVLEPEAVRRAVDGTLKPIYYKGKRVGSVREYSDTLMIVLLKAHAPEKYRERTETRHDGTIQVEVAYVDPD